MAQELQSLVGWGAKPSHCWKRHILRDLILSRHPELKKASQKVVGAAIAKFIFDATEKTKYPAAYRWLLFRNSEPAHQRRDEAIYIVGLAITWETWRGEPEFEFMRQLADVMLEGLDPERKAIFTCPCGRSYFTD